MPAGEALALLFAALAVSLPTFAWVALGVALKLAGLLPQALNDRISLLAFNYGLPVMLFAGAAQVDYSGLGSARYLLAGVLATLLAFMAVYMGTFNSKVDFSQGFATAQGVIFDAILFFIPFGAWGAALAMWVWDEPQEGASR